jgi:hypothetical protein
MKCTDQGNGSYVMSGRIDYAGSFALGVCLDSSAMPIEPAGVVHVAAGSENDSDSRVFVPDSGTPFQSNDTMKIRVLFSDMFGNGVPALVSNATTGVKGVCGTSLDRCLLVQLVGEAGDGPYHTPLIGAVVPGQLDGAVVASVNSSLVPRGRYYARVFRREACEDGEFVDVCGKCGGHGASCNASSPAYPRICEHCPSPLLDLVPGVRQLASSCIVPSADVTSCNGTGTPEVSPTPCRVGAADDGEDVDCPGLYLLSRDAFGWRAPVDGADVEVFVARSRSASNGTKWSIRAHVSKISCAVDDNGPCVVGYGFRHGKSLEPLREALLDRTGYVSVMLYDELDPSATATAVPGSPIAVNFSSARATPTPPSPPPDAPTPVPAPPGSSNDSSADYMCQSRCNFGAGCGRINETDGAFGNLTYCRPRIGVSWGCFLPSSQREAECWSTCAVDEECIVTPGTPDIVSCVPLCGNGTGCVDPGTDDGGEGEGEGLTCEVDYSSLDGDAWHCVPSACGSSCEASEACVRRPVPATPAPPMNIIPTGQGGVPALVFAILMGLLAVCLVGMAFFFTVRRFQADRRTKGYRLLLADATSFEEQSSFSSVDHLPDALAPSSAPLDMFD